MEGHPFMKAQANVFSAPRKVELRAVGRTWARERDVAVRVHSAGGRGVDVDFGVTGGRKMIRDESALLRCQRELVCPRETMEILIGGRTE